MVTVSQPSLTTPPLENGDHLSRSEFEQRYQAMAQHCKAELIEGITEDDHEYDYVEGAPELVVEIAASSASYDLHSKKQVYCRNGVQEYLVWRVLDQALDWFVLSNGDYVPLLADADGILRSQIFPGLWLAETDLLSGNLARVVSVLQLGRSYNLV